MMTTLFQGPMFRLNLVVMSSLALLAFGLKTPSGPVEVLQVPVLVMQIYFIASVLLKLGWRGFVLPMTRVQLGIFIALLAYVLLVSLMSPVASAQILVVSWVVHILFLGALLAFFNGADLDEAEELWPALGLTALLHVCSFLFVLVVWPASIFANSLPAFGNVRHLGYLLAPAAAVMAVLFAVRAERSLLSLICFSAASFYILYTGSRGGAVALLAGLTLTSVYCFWRGQNPSATRVLALLMVTGVLVLFSEILPALPWPTVFGRGVAAIDQSRLEMLQGRGIVWTFVVQAIQQNWLWGYGPGLISDLPNYPVRTAYYQPHNIGLQLFLHWGILGTCIIWAAIISFSSNVWRALCFEPRRAVAPLAALLTICVHALVDGGLFYPFSVVIAIIAFAMLVTLGGSRSNLR